MSMKWFLGAVAFLCSMISIFLNMLIFVPVFRLAFVSKKSTVYIIAFTNVLSDLCQLLVVAFYLSPSIMTNRYVLTGGADNSLSEFIGGFFLFAWYVECLVQVVMAVNRLTIITFQKYTAFTFRNTIVIFIFLISFTSMTAFTVQSLLPCCVFIGDHEVLSFRFISIEGVTNYSNYVLVSYDIFCTSTSTVCYICVFFTIRRSRANVSSSTSRHRSKQDVGYLAQFVFISIFYICTWVLFEILPHVVPNGQVEWYALVPVFITMNCSSNSVIYMSVNVDVQKMLSIRRLRSKQSDIIPSTTTRATGMV